MSNLTFQIIVVLICLAQLAALIWGVVPRGSRSGVLLVNLVLSVGVLYFLWPYLRPEIAEALAAPEADIWSYKTSIITAVELVVFVTNVRAIAGRYVPAWLIWAGFAANFLLSALVFVYAFFVEFPCCGLL
jgi:hypothetical protein